ncbi:hypothetical protein [Massilia sp. TWP1-3-3]|uniref:hypothetical protein n=1 Tax=Massilia sp. TWP1-3-3 TaxID=2804573 RepID=UPI003CF6F6E2
MQITLTKNKQLRYALASMMVYGYLGAAHARDGVAAPSETAISPAKYRELYQGSVIPVKYILVDEKGQECCNGRRPKKVFVLDITRDAPPRKIFSSEITELAGAHFEVEIDLETLVETPKADFVVLKLLRPFEYSKRAKPCAAGMGEDRHYLARIEKNAIRFIDRSLLGCGDTLSLLKDKNMVGYEVTVNHAGEDKAQLVRYVYRDGQMIKQSSALPSADRK